jgi:Tfp pilus assembly protein PilO
MSLFQRVVTEKRRFIYPLLTVIVVNVVLFLAVVYPLSARAARGEASANAAAQARAAAQRDYDSARATVSGKTSAEAELEKFYTTVLPPDESAARRITFLKIEQLERKTNLRQERRAFEVTQDRGSALGKLTITTVLTGQYRDVRRFIYEVETAPEFLVLENVSVSQGAESDRPLNVTVRIATYFRAEDDGR